MFKNHQSLRTTKNCNDNTRILCGQFWRHHVLTTEFATKNAQHTCVHVHYLGNIDVAKNISNDQHNGNNTF